MAKQPPIKIKPSKVGSLHTALGVPQGSKIPPSDLSVKPGDSPAMVKKKTFAKNAKSWNHAPTRKTAAKVSTPPRPDNVQSRVSAARKKAK